MGNITSTLTVKLVDDISGPAKKVAEALKRAEQQAKEIGRALEQAGVSSRLADQLRRIGASADQIKAVGAAWQSYTREAQLAARASDWTKAQAANVKTWERQTVGSLRNVIREEQRFAEAQRRARQEAFAGPGVPRGGGLGIVGGTVAGKIARTAGGVGVGLGLPAFGAAMTTGFVAKEAIEAGSNLEQAKTKLKIAGIPEAELAAALTQARQLAAKYKTTVASVLERYQEIRSSLGTPEETPKVMDAVIAADKAQKLSKKGERPIGEDIALGVKSAELLNRAKTSEALSNYLSWFLRAKQTFGRTITAESQHDFAANIGSTGRTLSDRFVNTIAQSYIQAIGGQKAGAQINQAVRQIVNPLGHGAVKEFARLGLILEEDIEKTKTGEVKGLKVGRHPKGFELAATDPDKWAYEHLQPAMERAGITSPVEQTAEIMRLFPGKIAGMFITEVLANRKAWGEHAKQVTEAFGLEAVAENMKTAAGAAEGLKASFENLGATTEGLMAPLAGLANSISDAVNAYATSQLTNKDILERAKNADIWSWLGKETGSIRDLLGRQPSTPPEGAAIAPQVDAASATNAASAADQAKMSFEQLGSVSVAPNVDTAAIDAAIGKARELEGLLSKLGSLAGSVGSGISADTAAAARLHAALGNIQRGRFATGGVQGD